MKINPKYNNHNSAIIKYAVEKWGNGEKRAMDYVRSIDHYIRNFFLDVFHEDIGILYEKDLSKLQELYDRMENDAAVRQIEIFKKGSIYRRAIQCYIGARKLYYNEFEHLSRAQTNQIKNDSNNEGSKKTATTTYYERNYKNRIKCIEHYGFKCYVCGFDFEKEYGERGRNFIEVHHVTPLHTTKTDHEVDPVKDLRPVCSNCHSMLHRKKECPNIEKFKENYRNNHR